MRLSPRIRRLLVEEVGRQLNDEGRRTPDVSGLLKQHGAVGTARITQG